MGLWKVGRWHVTETAVCITMLTNQGQGSGLALQYAQSSFSGQNNAHFPTLKADRLQKDFLLHIESEQGQTQAQRILHPMQREAQDNLCQ